MANLLGYKSTGDIDNRSVFMSLKCVIAIGYELGLDNTKWNIALDKLRKVILYKPSLFDASKSRFSMD